MPRSEAMGNLFFREPTEEVPRFVRHTTPLLPNELPVCNATFSKAIGFVYALLILSTLASYLRSEPRNERICFPDYWFEPFRKLA
jgi:hypothetical protein